MNRTITYLISDKDAGFTIEQNLRHRGYSAKNITHLKKTPESVLLNGIWVHMTHRLTSGDELVIRIVEEQSSERVPPVEHPIHIVYEDEDILVIDKQAGMPIHPSLNNYYNSLANALAWYFEQQKKPFIFRCVNRLDRDTSGLLIIAKHMLSACILSDQMVKRQIRREYRAVVCGNLPPEGTITVPIARVPGSTIMRQTDFENGEYACTHFTKLSYNSKNGLSYISLRRDTGRTHQIRVHMAHIGHPLPGDFLYHPDYRFINRQPLHSFRLDFIHPLTKEPMTFFAPLPDDMASLISEGAQTPASV